MKKTLLRGVFDRLIGSIRFRRWMARPVTRMRSSPFSHRILQRLGSGGDAWAANKGHDQFADLRRSYSIDFTAFIGQVTPSRNVGLIALADDDVVKYFFDSCSLLNITGELFDPSRSDFVQRITNTPISVFVCRPCHATTQSRLMYKEKFDAVSQLRGKSFFPNTVEQRIYEAKRELAYFLEANHIPHPRTRIFHSKAEALAFSAKCTYPQVFKTHNGAGSFGVEILRDRKKLDYLIQEIFDRYYINKSLSDYRDIDYGYILLQEFVEDVREFRVIKIGDSWFGHEKHKEAHQEFMSGSGVNKWTPPPHDLLDFCSELSRAHGLHTMCFDIFLDKNGQYLVNELQTWFGSYNPSQMYINEIPGRYVEIDGTWIFEPGLFNDLHGLPLRLVSILNS